MHIHQKVWLDHFEYHAQRPCVMPQARPDDLTSYERRLIASSLDALERRERSKGAFLLRATQAHDQTHEDAPLARIIGLVVAEQAHHAALLRAFMHQHGLPQQGDGWVHKTLCRIKRRIGFEAHISLLVTSELIGKVCYEALAGSTGCRQLQSLCRMLVADEIAHVGLESDLLLAMRARKGPLARAIGAATHRALLVGAAIMAAFTHRKTLRAAGLDVTSFVRACATQYAFYLEPPRIPRLSQRAA